METSEYTEIIFDDIGNITGISNNESQIKSKKLNKQIYLRYSMVAILVCLIYSLFVCHVLYL